MKSAPPSIRSLGIIMDGNRRWAKAKGLGPGDGHRAGLAALRALAKDSTRLKERFGIEYVTLYAFSQENWERDSHEVSLLLTLLDEALDELLGEIARDPKKIAVRIRMLGDRTRLSDAVRNRIEEIESLTKENTGGTIAIALSYSGRAEILEAVNRLRNSDTEPIDEATFSSSLWSAGIPDPDLIIRTSGEHRLSGFLLWQSAYSELFFTDTLWPDFTSNELETICTLYLDRSRRYGK